MPSRQAERRAPTPRTSGPPAVPGGQRLVVEPIAQLGELRIEPREELLRRQSAPGLGVHRLVAGGADAADDLSSESSTPASTAGTKSASSTQLAAASNTSGATFRQRQIFDHHHSDEYVPPIGARYSGACACAVSVIAAASAAAVWSFHSHACAARLLCQLRIERQRPRLRVDRQRRRAGGVDADADHAVAREPGRRRRPPAARRATDDAQALDVVGGILPRQVRLLRIEQHALVAARIVEHAASPTIRAVGASTTTARTEFVP